MQHNLFQKMHRLLSLPIAAGIVFILSAHCAAAQTEDPPVPVPCAPLADYVDPNYRDNFEMFMAGGDVPSDVPVMFTVPRAAISPPNPQVKLCIEDLPIPASVGGVSCEAPDCQNCWLIIGRHTGSNLNPDDVQYCKSSDSYRGTAPCYQCTCSGSDFGTGSVPPDRTLTDACGLNSQNNWGTTCPDVMNGRYNVTIGGYSNSSTIQINICGGIEDDCSICQGGGYQPSFRVGLQWSNRMDQCFANNPFTSDGLTVNSHNVLAFMISVSAAFASFFVLD